MSVNFEKYACKGNEFISLIAEELEVSRNKAGRIARAVFHALRNCLTHEESFQLMAQLPMALKGFYVDGWNFTAPIIKISSLQDFFDEVKREDAGLSGYNLADQAMATAAVASVFRQLNFVLSGGEMKSVRAIMPPEIKRFIKEITIGDDIIF
jgi:uncharacterized protein (DUF2267 family)